MKCLREELKTFIKSIGISQKEAADIISEGRPEFYECFKKDLNRCNNEQKLKNYIAILKSSEKYRTLKGCRARYEGDIDILGKERQAELHKISKKIKEALMAEDVEE
ncbi:hypothetical protein [Phocoenobacter skyensis]|uniref:Uncharacterized protein n=1 Tax=Phocoenobacter skyensis TaxID=97481 RepID=A0A1H7Z263_9PAST|nr:hypothetical protein [Pasteurella skyensis]MDP8080173.1 hypothetical protein [Pasteurella skyensis]MDP8086135.1 hypothetical protein [Pasteurella skyensis]MDP8185891.1 hypothetical protein [Pasteurella skyensis]QLB22954.1 hypothetical protein A6B44_06945 [Pasteurella skyensis]SEM52406.1 hypothetical protein SAMN05444853_1226 [Pasteurella skyensis]